MEDSAPGLFVSEPGNKATPLASGERVAAVAGGGGGRMETGRSIRFLPLRLFA